MSSIITNSTHIEFAKEMMNLTRDTDTPTYFFAGKIRQWGSNVFEDPNPSFKSTEEASKDIIYIKKIQKTLCSLGIKKYVWESGSIYSKWRDDVDMNDQNNWLSFVSPFYVYVESEVDGVIHGNVYLCLDNMTTTSELLTSTSKPSGQDTTPFNTIDGYKWIFLFSVKDSENDTFANDIWIPIAHEFDRQDSYTSNMIANTTPGTIDSAIIVSGGSGYNQSSTRATIQGDGTGAQITLNVQEGKIVGYTIVNRGSNYTTCKLIIEGDGIGADVHLIKSPNNGHGYKPEEQLIAKFALFKTGFVDTESGLFDTSVSYRQVGLIRGIKNLGGENLREDGYDCRSTIKVGNPSGEFLPLSDVVSTTPVYASAIVQKIIHEDDGTHTLYVVNKINTFRAGATITDTTNGVTGQVVSEDSPNINFSSGTVLYLEHLVGIVRKPAQAETFLFSIEF